jgi:hypothetical protein
MPKLKGRKAVALQLTTIRAQNMNRQKADHARIQWAQGMEEKTVRNNHQMEHDRLLGASQFGHMTPFALGRLADLKRLLGK